MCLSPKVVPASRKFMDVKMPSVSGNQSKEVCTSADEQALKVRKPYTITKQREKWTDEEHKKFLEALKLHGRAWRRIEEHVGTKTAVQIRSHAQKFFSKVIRESASRTADSVKPIEIPPPRPKKKPMHPYPRKLGCAPNKELPVLKKLERSPSPIESVSDQDNKSPTSVLSAIGSDMMGSSASNTPTRCLSSESFATGSNLAISVLTEQEKGSPSPRSASRVLNLDDKSPMEADYTCANENPMVEAPVTSLKLFGRTVLVTDAHKSSSSVTDSVKQCDKLLPPTSDENSKEDEERDEQTSVLSPSEEATQRNFCGISGEGLYNGWPGGMHPMFYCLPFQQENNASSSTTAPIPWWVFYGLPFPVVHPSHLSLQQHPPGNSKELQKEGSESGSNVASEGEAETVENKGDDGEEAQEPQLRIYGEKSTSISQKSGSQSKGFVPYKRRLSEKEGKKSDVSEDEDDRRRNPLCL